MSKITIADLDENMFVKAKLDKHERYKGIPIFPKMDVFISTIKHLGERTKDLFVETRIAFQCWVRFSRDLKDYLMMYRREYSHVGPITKKEIDEYYKEFELTAKEIQERALPSPFKKEWLNITQGPPMIYTPIITK